MTDPFNNKTADKTAQKMLKLNEMFYLLKDAVR